MREKFWKPYWALRDFGFSDDTATVVAKYLEIYPLKKCKENLHTVLRNKGECWLGVELTRRQHPEAEEEGRPWSANGDGWNSYFFG